MRLLDRFRSWMIGRYGSDQLNIALLVMYIILSILFSFTGWNIILLLGYADVILIFYRMFSKNTTKRWQENQKFLNAFGPIMSRFKTKGSRSFKNTGNIKADKNHKIFQCGVCGQKIRVPKGKGKIAITCPRCKKEFIKRT